jgi:hypothetical protein
VIASFFSKKELTGKITFLVSSLLILSARYLYLLFNLSTVRDDTLPPTVNVRPALSVLVLIWSNKLKVKSLSGLISASK